MASVGHGLIGLAFGGCVSYEARNRRLPYLWSGVLVLLAYAVDLAEWFATIFKPDLIDRRMVTHSPLLVVCLAVGTCVVLGVHCRLRRVWPYAVIVGVVLSHLLLDLQYVRLTLVQWYYGQTFIDPTLPYFASIRAELCVYGAPLVWVLLIRAALTPGTSAPTRAASWALLALSTASALSRTAALWGPLYALSTLHAVIVLRRHLKSRLLWNIVPLLPLFAMGYSTWLAAHRFEQAESLAQQGLDQQAVGVYQTALAVPSRVGRSSLYMRMGMSYERLGDLHAADRAYTRAVALSERPGWAVVVLSGFHARHEGTVFHRPDEAVRLLNGLLAGDEAPEDVRTYVRRMLKRLHERGVVW